MRVKSIVDENYQDYYKPSMLIATIRCDWKCCVGQGSGATTCHNAALAERPTIEVPVKDIFRRYMRNPLTSAIVLGGLEPLLQTSEIAQLISYFRSHGCNDDFVIYTGYDAHEATAFIRMLQQYTNIVIKYGRFVADRKARYDPVLGVWLSSANQYAERVS